MDFLSQTYNALRGPTGAPQTAIDTVRRLTDRLSQDTLLSDRRAAVLSLKGLSRDCKADVGEISLSLLLEVLEMDSEIDADIAKAVLETLSLLCEVGSGEGVRMAAGSKDLGMKHTDVVLQSPKATDKLFQLLGDQTFYTRFATLQLLQILLHNRKQVVQSYFLKSPVGLRNVIMVLEEKREIIRNEGLLMLQSLISQSAEIQKILAFEGGFEKLLGIVTSEGGIEGGVVVQDSLTCIDELLRFNVSNQSYFRETSLLPHLTPLLSFPSNLPATVPTPQEFALQFWEPQKVVNAGLVVSIIGMLIGGKGTALADQNTILRCLRELALASNAPTSVKAQALRILPSTAAFPNAVLTPYQPVPNTNGEEWDRLEPVTSLDALVNTALEGEYGGINEGEQRKRDAIELRALCLGVFENFTRDEEIRLGVLRGMLPPAPDLEQSPPNIASLNLLSALATLPNSPLTFSTSTRTHLSALLFASLLRSSLPAKSLAQAIVPRLASHPLQTPSVGGAFFIPADGAGTSKPQKEKQLGDEDTDNDDPPQTLLQTLAEHLSLSFLTRGRAIERGDGREEREWDRLIVGYLSLLCRWLWESPNAVREFLEAGGLSVLVEQVNQTSGMDVLVQGMCAFLIVVCYEYNREPGEITRHTIYAILNRLSSDALVARMVRAREDERFKAIGPDALVLPYPAAQSGPLTSNGNAKEEDDWEVWFDWGFVEFWRSNFYSMQRAVNTDPDSLSTSLVENPEAAAQISSLRDVIRRQAAEMDALKIAANKPVVQSDSPETITLLNSLRSKLQKQTAEVEELHEQLADATRSREANRVSFESQMSALKAELESTKDAKRDAEKEQEDLLVYLDELSGKRRRDKQRMREAGLDVSDDEEDE